MNTPLPAPASCLDDDAVQTLHATARRFWMQGQLDDAIHSFAALVGLRPKDPRFLSELAQVHRQAGRWDAALVGHMLLHLLEREQPRHELDMAECLLGLGQREAAQRMLGRLVERAPGQAEVPGPVLQRARALRDLLAREPAHAA